MNEIIYDTKCVINNCRCKPLENKYCSKHQRRYQYDEGIKSGKHWCRFFFRGCSNEISVGIKTCEDCLTKKFTDKVLCAHKGCKFHVKEGFCGKHERDRYRIEEKEKGIRYCDISRGCFTLCKEGMASCDSCLEKERTKEHTRFIERSKLHESVKKANLSNTQICVGCGKDYIRFKTKYNHESKRCPSCAECQQKQDDKRKDRIRNYKEENLKYPLTYFKEYNKNALIRDISFYLTFEQFNTLIQKPCHYCTHFIETEANGIDRVNNSLGYTVDNCVSCCWHCNRMKSFYHPVFFVEKCRILSTTKKAGLDFYERWMLYYSRTCNNSYAGYKHTAITRRNFTFDITKEQWDKLTRSPCYLCGYQQIEGIGLDRIDNEERFYNLDNCKPCCGSCNSMKHDLPYDEFMETCTRVATNWPSDKMASLRAIPPYGNPLKAIPYESKPRTYWKIKTLYFATIAGKEDDFLETHREILEEEEFREHVTAILLYPTFEAAEPYIRRFLNTMTQRRKRAKPKNLSSLTASVTA